MTVSIDKFKNKEYAYLHTTEFLVQVAKLTEQVYETKFRCSGDMKKATKHYSNMLPISNHKKRIVMVGNLGETIIDMENF